MITNKSITYYHKDFDVNRLTTWTKYIFNDVWLFARRGSTINEGYENAHDVNVRIPLSDVNDVSIFEIGDIVCVGTQSDIAKQSDLEGKEFYNVTSIAINDFGGTPHIHLGGR